MKIYLKTKRYSEHSTFVSSVRVLKRERFHNANLRGSRKFIFNSGRITGEN